MKLVAKCPTCGKLTKIKARRAKNRKELAVKNGEFLEMLCEECNHRFKAHVDHAIAIADQKVNHFGLILIVIALVLAIYYWKYGFISMAFIILPIIILVPIKSCEQAKVSQFNHLSFHEIE